MSSIKDRYQLIEDTITNKNLFTKTPKITTINFSTILKSPNIEVNKTKAKKNMINYEAEIVVGEPELREKKIYKFVRMLIIWVTIRLLEL